MPRHIPTRRSTTVSLRVAAIVLSLLGVPPTIAAQGIPGREVASEPQEARPYFLPLPDFLVPRASMVSGLAWYGDDLILLPQQRPVEGQRSIHRGKLYSVSRQAIEREIDAPTGGPLPIDAWELVTSGVDSLDGFGGFESIAFAGDTVFMTVESNSPPGPRAWLLRGRMDAEHRTVRMEPAEVVIMGQSGIHNLTEETLVTYRGEVISIHEANGAGVNPDAVAHAFPIERTPGSPWTGRVLPMTSIEYRVTDATMADSEGRFWVINYFFPGDSSLRASDDRFGGPPSQSRAATHDWISRLVELRVTSDGIVPTGRPPLYLEHEESWNWEGIARLGSRGFLLVSDKYPLTDLAFVPLPGR